MKPSHLILHLYISNGVDGLVCCCTSDLGRCWDQIHLNSVHITYNKHTTFILLLLHAISIIQAFRSSARMLKIATLCSKQMKCSRGDKGCEIMLVQAQSVGSSEQQQDPCFLTVTCHNACYHLATTG